MSIYTQSFTEQLQQFYSIAAKKENPSQSRRCILKIQWDQMTILWNKTQCAIEYKQHSSRITRSREIMCEKYHCMLVVF